MFDTQTTMLYPFIISERRTLTQFPPSDGSSVLFWVCDLRSEVRGQRPLSVLIDLIVSNLKAIHLSETLGENV